MILTEEEANTKWCGLSLARETLVRNCIGSECMMWREANLDAPEKGCEGVMVPWIKKHRELYGSSLKVAKEAFDRGDKVSGGYCGLAGRP